MNQITFPGLGLQLTISKTAFSILGTNIAWYAVLIVSAFLIAILIYKKQDGLYSIKFQEVLNLSIYVIPIAIISARIYYVLFNLEYFMQNPTQILNIKQGGLAIYGGIIGGAGTCYIYAKKKNISLLDLLDHIVPSLALRTGNRQMGKFYKCRSLWNRNYEHISNGNNRKWCIQRGASNIFVWICNRFSNFHSTCISTKKEKIQRSNYLYLYNLLFFCKNFYRRTSNRQLNAWKLQNFTNFINNSICHILYLAIKKRKRI